MHAARLTTGSESIYVGCANERRHKKRKWVIPCDVTRNLTSDVYTHWGHIDTIPEWHTLSPPAYSATPHVWLRWPLSGLWNSHFPWFSCCTFFSVSFPPFRPSSSGYSLKKNFFLKIYLAVAGLSCSMWDLVPCLGINRDSSGTPLQYSHLANPMDGGAW